MITKEQQKGEMEVHTLPQDVANHTKSVDESRRRFTKSGLAVSGVLLTLASRPSLGGGGGGGGGFACKSPSGFISGNLSQHGTPQTCSGRTPGYWGTHGGGGPQPNAWPSPYLPGTCASGTSCNNSSYWSGGTKFSSVFSCTHNGLIYKDIPGTNPKKQYSMMQVIWLTGSGDPNQLGAHIVAALLNAASGKTLGVLTEAQVINIFNEWDQKGYFEPTAGVKWYGADIVDYLKSTMPL